VCRTNLAMLLQGEGRLDEARLMLLGALEIQRKGGARLYEGYCLACLGIVAHESGDLHDGARYYSEALQVFGQVGNRRWEGVINGYVSLLSLETGLLDEATVAARQAEAILTEVGDLRCKGFFQACLGAIEAVRGNSKSATRALEAAAKHAAHLNESLLNMTVEVSYAFLDLHFGKTEAAQSRLDQATAMLGSDQKKAIQSADMSDILRIMVRILSKALQGAEP
jgi:tetratricopeptide (TPR) repeat protein